MATTNPSRVCPEAAAPVDVRRRAALLVAREAIFRALATLGSHRAVVVTVDNLVAQLLGCTVAALPVVCIGTAPMTAESHARVLYRHTEELGAFGGEEVGVLIHVLRKILGALELGVTHA